MTQARENYLVGSTLLMIDDSPINLKIVAKALETSGAELLVAVDGEEGLQRAQATKPDLILLDVMMPGIDGFEVCRRLKQNSETRDIPVIFMTSLSDTADKVTGFEAGGIDYLTKPLQLDEAKARINSHLRMRALQSQLEENNASLQAEIQQRKHLEHTLREQSEFQQSLLNAIRDMGLQILVVEGGRIIHVGNLALAKKYGFTDKIVADQPPFADVIHPDDRQRVMEYYRLRLSGGDAPHSYEAGMITPEGERYEFEITSELIPDSEPLQVVSLMRDITARKHMEIELHRREEAFRAMAENTPDTIARYDRDCQQIYSNPSLQKLLDGESQLSLVSADDSVVSDSVIGYRKTLEEVMVTGKETEYTLHWESADNRTIWSQIRIVPERDTEGNIISVLAIGRDVTEMVETEQRLYESREMLRKLLVRQEVEHDARQTRAAWEVYDSLGQLLMVQRLDIGLLQQNSFADEAAREAHLEKMQGITDKAIAIVRSVSAELRPSAFNMGISLALEWIIEEFHKRTDIRCKLTLAEDQIKLKEVKANMLFHIVQDSLENIRVRGDAKQVRIRLEPDNDCYVLQICDDGKGMELGDPNEGNLGLFYIQERVHAIGGEVVVLNQPGEGTVLEVRIPINAKTS